MKAPKDVKKPKKRPKKYQKPLKTNLTFEELIKLAVNTPKK